MEDLRTFDKIKKYFLERKYVLLLLFWVVHVVWYFVLNSSLTDEACHLMHISLDDKIPYVKYFVIPYVLWYGYIAFAHIWTFFHSKRDFVVMCCLIFLSNLVSILIFTIYPTMHDMRPAEDVIGYDFFGSIVRWLYGTENPYCIMPSEHCMLAIVITVGLIFSDGLKDNLFVKIVCPIYTVLVMLSTVFIKQHSIVDVFAATALCVPICLVTYLVICPKKRFAPKADTLPEPETDPALEDIEQPDEAEAEVLSTEESIESDEPLDGDEE
ncbi:MAG: phosphatase PAP2 family protein [Clostridia bacterium]|nr:phosphatase PAP2 family protein [Clostridia bacterium]